MNVHPKVAASSIAGLAFTALMLAITQYAPHYAPNADLSAALTTFVTALAGYYKRA